MSVKLVALVAIVTGVSCLNAGVMVTVRILHGLARDGLFPAFAAHVNRGGTPDRALAITALLTILLTLSGQFQTAFLVIGAMGVFTYAITDAALFRLRASAPELARPFRAFGYPWLPALALLLDVGLVAAFLWSDLKSAAFMVATVAICVPISWWVRRRRRLGAPAPERS
jgi:APA family basic amino acid/polyamine antiporter